VLRRIANHLFWLGRYLERAEWRARLVDVNYHLLVQSPQTQEGWLPLLAITGDRDSFAGYSSNSDEVSVLQFFTLEERNPSAIRNCIALARENCRALRNHISSELWLEVNTLYLDSQTWESAAFQEPGVYAFFFDLRQRFYRLSGVVENTLPRDLGFDFLLVGRTLEAAEDVTRLLDVKYHFLLPRVEDVGTALDLAQWAALLRSASALEAYRATYGNAIGIEQVVEFLLFDPAFPRAARFSLELLLAALGRIAAAAPASPPAAASPTAAALVERLSHGHAKEVIETGLHEYLLGLQDDCARVGDEVFAAYLKTE